MARISKIEADLAEADLAEFRRLLATGRLTIDSLVTWLEGRGYEISRSSVGRYAQNFEQVAQKLRQSRQVTDALVAELGDAASQGKQGRLLVEMTRSLVFDMLMKLQVEGAGGLDPKDTMMLGKGLAELGRALRYDQDFETKIRQQLAAEIRQEAAAEAEVTAQEAGLSADVVAQIKSKILGVAA
ncbi:MAG: DUF3486 family protein [Sneathiellaceae bacterium]